jgi:hypothetical protein
VKAVLLTADGCVVPIAAKSAGDGQGPADSIAQRLECHDQIGMDRA